MFNPVTIGLHMVNALILGVGLYFLFYMPVRSFMKKRQNTVQSQLDDASARSEQAEQMRRESERLLEDAQRKAAETIAQSAQIAQKRAQDITDRAQEEIKRVRARAQADIDKMRIQAQEAIRDEAADLAVQMAEKLISRGITSDDHARLIDALIERL